MKKIISIVLMCSFILCALSSCGKNTEPEYYDAYFVGMDTTVTLRLARDSGQKDGRKTIYFEDSYLDGIAKHCSEIVSETEAELSRTIEGSLVWDVNKETDSVLSLDPEFLSLLEKSLSFSAETGGAFDVTVGTLTELWNITGDEHNIPSEEEITEALSHVGNDKITIDGVNLTKSDRKTKIDLGAIGKGYALSKIMEYLESTDILYGLVSFGGNISVFGYKTDGEKYKIGITDPFDTSKVVGYVYIDSGFVSVSGDYERYFVADGVKYHHIFDSKTGYPADSDITSVAVLSHEGDMADALSTALFVMGSDAAIEFYNSGLHDFEAVIVKKDGTVVLTDGLSSDETADEDKIVFEPYIEETEETN